jgi:hypothetical protein
MLLLKFSICPLIVQSKRFSLKTPIIRLLGAPLLLQNWPITICTGIVGNWLFVCRAWIQLCSKVSTTHIQLYECYLRWQFLGNFLLLNVYLFFCLANSTFRLNTLMDSQPISYSKQMQRKEIQNWELYGKQFWKIRKRTTELKMTAFAQIRLAWNYLWWILGKFLFRNYGIISNFSGPIRQPPKNFLKQLNEQFPFNVNLCQVNEPDILSRVCADLGPQHVLPTIITYLTAKPTQIEVVPLISLCQLYLVVVCQQNSLPVDMLVHSSTTKLFISVELQDSASLLWIATN